MPLDSKHILPELLSTRQALDVNETCIYFTLAAYAVGQKSNIFIHRANLTFHLLSPLVSLSLSLSLFFSLSLSLSLFLVLPLPLFSRPSLVT